MELCLGMGDKPAETLWVRVSRRTNMGNIVVGGCYILSDWKEVDFSVDKWKKPHDWRPRSSWRT